MRDEPLNQPELSLLKTLLDRARANNQFYIVFTYGQNLSEIPDKYKSTIPLTRHGLRYWVDRKARYLQLQTRIEIGTYDDNR